MSKERRPVRTPLNAGPTTTWWALCIAALAAAAIGGWWWNEQDEVKGKTLGTAAQRTDDARGFGSAKQLVMTVVAGRTDSGVCDVDEFIHWLRENGALIHSSLRIVDCADKGCDAEETVCPKGGRGVMATNSIERGAVLFKVPDSLTFSTTRTSTHQAFAELPHASLRTAYLQNDHIAAEYTRLAAALLIERRAGTASPFWRYITCLPSVHECPSLPCFSDDEIASLSNANVAEVARRDRKALLQALRRVLARHGDFDDDELAWAFGMVLSRAFVANGIPRLIPFVDMLNHHSASGDISINSKSSKNTGNSVDSWQKTSARTFETGDEVFWAYKTNATMFDLLYLYGISGDVDGPREIAVDVEWHAPTPSIVRLAVRLFRGTSATRIAPLPPTSGGVRARVSLVFCQAGIDPVTLGYARVIALVDALARGGAAAKQAETSLKNWHAGVGTSHNLSTSTEARPLGTSIESAALQTLLGVVKAELRGVTAAQGSQLSSRLEAAAAFDHERTSILRATQHVISFAQATL
eukprot:m.465292 g.465292  ORF g.465292 m.465292 type:complete len:526 (-) comp24076_c0_seq1:439-2016(-)